MSAISVKEGKHVAVNLLPPRAFKDVKKTGYWPTHLLEHFKPNPQQSKDLTVHSTGKPAWHPASSPH